jgi:hypothetical protein
MTTKMPGIGIGARRPGSTLSQRLARSIAAFAPPHRECEMNNIARIQSLPALHRSK